MTDLPAFFLRYRAACVAAGLPAPAPEAVALLIDVLLACLADEFEPPEPADPPARH